jgi:hypothetical protein
MRALTQIHWTRAGGFSSHRGIAPKGPGFCDFLKMERVAGLNVTHIHF